MLVTSTHSSVARRRRRPAPPHPPSRGDTLTEAAALIAAPALYGPPVSFLLIPWLFLVLLLAPPFAVLFTIVLVLAVAAVLLAALVALVASPYLLARRISAHRALHAMPQASPRPRRTHPVSTVRIGSPQVKGVS
jgi:hypothetical protein